LRKLGWSSEDGEYWTHPSTPKKLRVKFGGTIEVVDEGLADNYVSGSTDTVSVSGMPAKAKTLPSSTPSTATPSKRGSSAGGAPTRTGGGTIIRVPEWQAGEPSGRLGNRSRRNKPVGLLAAYEGIAGRTVVQAEHEDKPGEAYANAYYTAKYMLNSKVVHGRVFSIKLGRRIAHAWVEDGNVVHDPTVKVEIPKSKYYGGNIRAKADHVYMRDEVAVLMAQTGNWGPYTDAERARKDKMFGFSKTTRK